MKEKQKILGVVEKGEAANEVLMQIFVRNSRPETRVSTERVSEKLTTFALRPGYGTRVRVRHKRNQGSTAPH